MSKTKKYLIGLTGQTGAGKTSVANILKENGFEIIEADVVSREVTNSNPALLEIVKHFKKGVLDEDGNLNRKVLAKIVFNDEKELEKLNEIVHPHILKELFSMIEKIDNNIIVLDAPTLIESNLYKDCDFIIVVTAPLETRIKRIRKRDKLPYQEVHDRIFAQESESFYTKHADIVIDNYNRALPNLKTKSTHLANFINNKFINKGSKI